VVYTIKKSYQNEILIYVRKNVYVNFEQSIQIFVYVRINHFNLQIYRNWPLDRCKSS